MAESPVGRQLGTQIRAVLGSLAGYLALVIRNNPAGSADALLARPDVAAVIRAAVEEARAQAESVLEQVWFIAGAVPGREYAGLHADLAAALGDVAHVRGLIRHAYASVPRERFVPGITPPGDSPEMDAAGRRAAAVRDAVLAWSRKAALSARMTIAHADAAAVTAARLQGAAGLPGARKTWRRNPGSASCLWCRRLDGTTLALGGSFAAALGGPVRVRGQLVAPPRLYRHDLQGPPLHPFCGCGVDITAASDPAGIPSGGSQAPGGPRSPAPAGPSGFLEAADIRAMPEGRYQADLAFLRAAAHELDQVLGRLAEGSGGLR